MPYNKIVYELTLTENYVSDWTFQDAMRELIQNGIDQEVIDKENVFTMEYDNDRKTIILTNTRSKLSVNTLLLGKSSKSDNEDTVGQFGEGYKIASLVLNRLGKTFTIKNNEKNEVWTSKFKNSEKWKERILTFYVEDVESEDTGLVIEIGNIERKEYNTLEDTWLNFEGYYDEADDIIHTSKGDILMGEWYKGKIFVNGLSISSGTELEYGYNFKPRYVKVERDRKTCDSWNIREITCVMISEAMVNGDLDFEKVSTLIHENRDDVYNIVYNGCESEVKMVKEELIKSFDENNKSFNESEIVVPVSTQEQIKLVTTYGGKAVVVPHKVSELLKSETDKRIKELITRPREAELSLKERFQIWYDLYSSGLSYTARNELAELITFV